MYSHVARVAGDGLLSVQEFTGGYGPDMRPNIFPALHHSDAETAVEWLKHTFGFEERPSIAATMAVSSMPSYGSATG
jgi:hypothetical protein